MPTLSHPQIYDFMRDTDNFRPTSPTVFKVLGLGPGRRSIGGA
jgi:hypothetical protein